jgi:hypothetical protein
LKKVSQRTRETFPPPERRFMRLRVARVNPSVRVLKWKDFSIREAGTLDPLVDS